MELSGLRQLKFLVETDTLPSRVAVDEVMRVLSEHPSLLTAHDVIDVLRENAHTSVFSKWESEWHVSLEQAELLLARMQSLPPRM